MAGVLFASIIGAQSGCFYPRGWDRGAHENAYVVDGVLVAAGAIVFLGFQSQITSGGCDTCELGPLIFGGVPIVTGALGALVNWGVSGDWTDPDREVPPPIPVDEIERDARAAASAGDCAAVRQAIVRLAQRDPARAGALDAEPAIAACVR